MVIVTSWHYEFRKNYPFWTNYTPKCWMTIQFLLAFYPWSQRRTDIPLKVLTVYGQHQKTNGTCKSTWYDEIMTPTYRMSLFHSVIFVGTDGQRYCELLETPCPGGWYFGAGQKGQDETLRSQDNLIHSLVYIFRPTPATPGACAMCIYNVLNKMH
jgi:hypothetical protein